MSKKQDLAQELFNSGFNCSQSVLAAFAEDYGLSREYALKISGGFGGGFRCGEICGAVSGAVAVIGLKHGQYINDDAKSKAECGAKTAAFMDEFKEKNSFITCREILGINLTDRVEFEQAKSKGSYKEICSNMVKSAVALLEESGY